MIQTYVQKHSTTFATILLEIFILKLKYIYQSEMLFSKLEENKRQNKQTVGKTEKCVIAQKRRLPGCQEIVLYFYFIPRRLFFSSCRPFKVCSFYSSPCDFLSCFSFVDQEGNHQRSKQRISFIIYKRKMFSYFF